MLLLGRLHIENSFHVIGEPAPGTSPLLVCDQMDVKLDNISLCRCVDSCILFYMRPRCCNVYCMSTTTHNLGAVMCTKYSLCCRQVEAEDSVAGAQRCLLKPVHMTAVVKRSLSPWYNGRGGQEG